MLVRQIATILCIKFVGFYQLVKLVWTTTEFWDVNKIFRTEKVSKERKSIDFFFQMAK